MLEAFEQKDFTSALNYQVTLSYPHLPAQSSYTEKPCLKQQKQNLKKEPAPSYLSPYLREHKAHMGQNPLFFLQRILFLFYRQSIFCCKIIVIDFC